MIKDGVHEIIDDSIILRLLVSRSFDYNVVKDDLLYHLEWRKSRVPISLLTEKTMFLLSKGFFYIHGRTKAGNPILFLDFKRMLPLMEAKEINPASFCALHHFYASYMVKNMLVPGQVEKWFTITNIN